MCLVALAYWARGRHRLHNPIFLKLKFIDSKLFLSSLAKTIND